jgi:N-acetylmuramoyl-L-alanine amidase
LDGKFRVALDIGHTLRSGGAISATGVPEYRFNTRMVSLIDRDLKQTGLMPFLIDSTGKPISLLERTVRANTARADLFLAVHHDSANDRYLRPVKINERTFLQSTEFEGYSIFFSRKNRFPEESLQFARDLGSAMRQEDLHPTTHHAEAIPGENRDLIDPELGVYRFDDLVVLKRAEMPAALLECGVIINPKEEDELNKPERQMKIVRAVRQAVLKMAEATLQHRNSDSQTRETP